MEIKVWHLDLTKGIITKFWKPKIVDLYGWNIEVSINSYKNIIKHILKNKDKFKNEVFEFHWKDLSNIPSEKLKLWTYRVWNDYVHGSFNQKFKEQEKLLAYMDNFTVVPILALTYFVLENVNNILKNIWDKKEFRFRSNTIVPDKKHYRENNDYESIVWEYYEVVVNSNWKIDIDSSKWDSIEKWIWDNVWLLKVSIENLKN
jgi:hypothetical protein